MQINSKTELEQAIIELEKKKIIQQDLLVTQFHETYESMKPMNLIKNAFSKITHSPETQSGVLKTVAGIGVGLLTKRLFVGNSASLVKKILGSALELGAAKTAINNTDKVKAYGTAIYNNLFKKRSAHKGVD